MSALQCIARLARARLCLLREYRNHQRNNPFLKPLAGALALVLIPALLWASSVNASANIESPRTLVPLADAWRFQFAEGSDAWAATAFDDAGWEAITVPHTWNNFDGQDGGSDYRRGNGWYRTHFSLPEKLGDKRVLVEFDAACKVADVFVNGKAVGSHTGAFARFRFDITDAIKSSGDNVLAVRVNNAPSQIIPISGDFTQNGGIYRTVRLMITEPVHIATLDYASSGVYLTTPTISADKATVNARVKFASEGKSTFKGNLRVRINDASGKVVATAEQKITVEAGKNGEANLPLQINQPHLWNGTADPYQYRVTAELASGKKVLDSVDQPLGLRNFKFDPSQGFLLNDQHLPLHGVNRHQDRANKGWAIGEENAQEDMGIMQEMGVNAVRLAHYQHATHVYNLTDGNGMVVWAELVFVNEAPTTKEGADNAKEQLRELIRQNFNHPSIFMWSIGNETGVRKGDGIAEGNLLALNLLKDLAAVAHEEDGSRPSTYASDHGLTEPRNFLTNILAFNKYFGWYYGTYSDMGKFLDMFHTDNPNIPVGISEYGAGASIYQHEDNPPVRIHLSKGAWHPEEWQTTYHEENWLQIQARPWLWGTFVWNMFDFSADRRTEGDIFGRNDKGLVTIDRQVRKDAFYWYQANWTTKPMVHITSKRFWERSTDSIDIKVYSNTDEVELKVNGVSLGKQRSTDHRYVWKSVKLNSGSNRVEAYAYQSGKMIGADWTGITYRKDGEPKPNQWVHDVDAAAAKARAAGIETSPVTQPNQFPKDSKSEPANKPQADKKVEKKLNSNGD